MSAPLKRSSRQANTPLRIACHFPNCKHWFSNKAGLTQHINRFHPDFLASAPTVVLTSSRSIPVEQDGEPIEPTGTGLHPPHAGVAGKAENLQWHGPGAKVYRNYHSKLTGEFSDLNVCLSHPLSLTCRAPL